MVKLPKEGGRACRGRGGEGEEASRPLTPERVGKAKSQARPVLRSGLSSHCMEEEDLGAV